MPLTREQKEEQIAEVSQNLQNSKMTVLVDYKGLDVTQIQSLRKQLLDNGCEMKVAKNTLIKLALEGNETFSAVDKDLFEGPTALVFGYGDQVAPAKTVVNFGKDNEEVEVLGGFNIEGEMYSIDQIEELATLPSKEELQAKLVGTINAPISGFVNVLAGNVRGLVNVIRAVEQSKA